MNKKIKYSYLKLKSSLRKKLFGKYTIGVIYDTKNGKIMAPLDDLTVGKKLGFNGEYDISEVNIIKDLIRTTDTIYVVGTHWGTLLLPLSKHCKQIIGYEANPSTFSFLEINILINKVTNVSAFNNAVGESYRKVKFYQSTINSGGSKIKPKIDKYMYKYDNPDTIEVDMISLDKHILEKNLPEVNGIIMDIEGAEYYALQGMTNALKKSNFLYIEYVPHHLENVSNTSNEAFFNLILPHYNTVRFMNDTDILFNINENKKDFFSHINKLKMANKADNLLFIK
ncbi:MAG: FkbM family methyltransferase [Flavobacteriaceae bacterium]|nr:FkbM family methyltransferase [Flavobacteriaceae bacterium]